MRRRLCAPKTVQWNGRLRVAQGAAGLWCVGSVCTAGPFWFQWPLSGLAIVFVRRKRTSSVGHARANDAPGD